MKQVDEITNCYGAVDSSFGAILREFTCVFNVFMGMQLLFWVEYVGDISVPSFSVVFTGLHSISVLRGTTHINHLRYIWILNNKLLDWEMSVIEMDQHKVILPRIVES